MTERVHLTAIPRVQDPHRLNRSIASNHCRLQNVESNCIHHATLPCQRTVSEWWWSSVRSTTIRFIHWYGRFWARERRTRDSLYELRLSQYANGGLSLSMSGMYSYAVGYDILRVSGIWEAFRKLNTTEVDGMSKDGSIFSPLQSGVSRGNVSCFEALLLQTANSVGIAPAKGEIQ